MTARGSCNAMEWDADFKLGLFASKLWCLSPNTQVKWRD